MPKDQPTCGAAMMWPWRDWARANGVGLNKTKAAISSGALRVKRLGNRNFITAQAGAAFVESLPDGPAARPARLDRFHRN